jgi:hypothetical protein
MHRLGMGFLRAAGVKDRSVKRGHLRSPCECAGNGLPNNLTALLRAEDGPVREWRNKKAFLGCRGLLGIQCRLPRYIT